jgi:hypothetical protein
MGVPDRGQAVPLLVAAIALVGVAVLAVARLGVAVVESARARTAADAAALAGARDGERAASVMAAANGGVVDSFITGDDSSVTVVVRVGGATARARAVLVVEADPATNGADPSLYTRSDGPARTHRQAKPARGAPPPGRSG